MKAYLDALDKMDMKAVNLAAELAELGAAMPKCAYDFEYESDKAYSRGIPHDITVLNLSCALRFKAERDSKEGNVEAAWKSLLLAAKAGDSLRNDPFLISQLIRMSIAKGIGESVVFLLANGAPPPELAAALRKELESLADPRPIVRCIDGERIFFADAFANGLNQTNYLMIRLGPQSDWLFMLSYLKELLPFSPLKRLDLAKGMNLLSEAAANFAERPTAENLRAYDQKLGKLPFYCPLSKATVPGISGVKAKFLLTQSLMRESVLALNLVQYKKEHGAYPQKLADCGAEGDALLDPFTGKEFVYQTDGQGFSLRSPALDFKFDRKGARNDDIVLRLPAAWGL